MKQLNIIMGKVVDKLYLLLAFFLVLFAILVTIARAFTPILKHYNQNFATWAETFIKKPVAIQQIKAGWDGFHPVLDLHNVLILNKTKDKTLFRLQDLQVSLNIFKSLLKHKVIINRLFVRGAHLVILQDKNKQWSIKGLSNTNVNNKGEELQEFLKWTFEQPELAIKNINLQINLYGHKPYLLHNLALMLSNTNIQHHLQGRAYLAKDKNSPIDIAINLKGIASKIKALQGNFYIQAEKISFDNWLLNKDFYGFKYKNGTFSFNLWGDWQKQSIDNVQAKLELNNLEFQPTTVINNPFYVNKLQANLFWHQLTNGGWQLSGDKINFNLNHRLLATKEFNVYFLHSDTSTNKQLFQVNALKLQDLNLLLSHFTLLPNKFRQAWQNFSPSGELKNVQFTHVGNFKRLNLYHLEADLKNLQWNNVKKIPGFSGLSGHVNMTNKSGELTVKSHNMVFVDNKLFRNSLDLNSLTGLIQWQSINNAWLVQAYNIDAVTPEINLIANMNLQLPFGKGVPYISLFSTYKEKDLSRIKTYFPVKIMPKGVVSWLDQAFVQGDGAQGSLLLFGPLTHFPFIKNDGQFIVDSDLHKLQLNYLSAWPNIKNLSGNLIFTKRCMNFTTNESGIAQQTIKQLTATIPNFASEPQSRLYVKGKIELHDLSRAKQFVLHSPLKDTIGKKLQPLKMQGEGGLDLNLNIPLEFGNTITTGKLTLPDNELSIPSWDLQFKNIQGVLNFTDNSLSANQLKANFYNEPATVTIRTLHINKKRTTRFNIDTKTHISDVKNYFSIKDHGFITGLAPLHAILDIPAKGENHLRVKSNLRGIEINLPKPYYKNKDTTHPLQIDSYFSNTVAPIITINYPNLFMTSLAYSKKEGKLMFSRANIHFGLGRSKLPTQPGIFIDGSLNDFSWSSWKKILLPYLQLKVRVNNKDVIQNAVLKQIDLKINNLTAFSQHLLRVALLIIPKFDSWMVAIDSNKISGKLTIPLDYKHKTTIGYFKLLNLAFPKLKDIKQADNWDPYSMIPINISADAFNYNNHEYGKIQLAAAPIKNGLQVSTLKIINSLYTLSAKGRWLRIKKKDSSAFSGLLTTENLGELLKQENFTTHLYKGKGSANFKLEWPDKPSNFQTKSLQGNISARFTDGAIIGLDKKTNQKLGLGKVINVLSLSNLARHLTFNFDEKGYNFSELRGDLNLYHGILKTNNTYLNGSVAELYIVGELGLKKQTYNLLVTINPYITSSLPVLATIVGGPVAGIATWAVSKLARAGVKKAVVYQYHLGGTWGAPIVKDVVTAHGKNNN